MPLAVSYLLSIVFSVDRYVDYIEPLTQIVAGVGLLLAGVLNLVGNLLKGLGLDSLLRGIVAATVN